MTWNWQHKDWPHFIYSAANFQALEAEFIHKAGYLHGSMKHITHEDKEELRIHLMRDEALKTSEIEGEILDRDSLQSSIRRHFGLKTDNRQIPPAEHGISEMMVDLYQNATQPLTHKALYQWHEMLTNGRRDLKNIGAYRSHGEPMQIVSGDFLDPVVHFEAPPSETIAQEMDAFINWFNTGSKADKSALIRAGIAHIYFESLHPFEDGNGRIGRAISEKALSQSLGRPTLIAISSAIQSTRKAYYAALQSGSKGLDISEWLHYFCETVLKAQDHTQLKIDFVIEKGQFYQRFDDAFNPRQAKVIKRMFKEGVNGFKGGLSADNYITLTQTSRATATRDLQNLSEKGALIKTGELKYARYHLNVKTIQRVL